MTRSEVAAGQLWRPRVNPHIHAARRVTRVDGALVATDAGRTTVFALRRHYRLVEEPSS